MSARVCIDCGQHRSAKSAARCRPCHDKATQEFALTCKLRPIQGVSWCEQCERRVTPAEGIRCASLWCKAKVAA